MSERASPYAVHVDSHDPPVPTPATELRALVTEMIGRIIQDDDAFEGIASGRLPQGTNQGRGTWQEARDWMARCDALLARSA